MDSFRFAEPGDSNTSDENAPDTLDVSMNDLLEEAVTNSLNDETNSNDTNESDEDRLILNSFSDDFNLDINIPDMEVNTEYVGQPNTHQPDTNLHLTGFSDEEDQTQQEQSININSSAEDLIGDTQETYNDPLQNLTSEQSQTEEDSDGDIVLNQKMKIAICIALGVVFLLLLIKVVFNLNKNKGSTTSDMNYSIPTYTSDETYSLDSIVVDENTYETNALVSKIIVKSNDIIQFVIDTSIQNGTYHLRIPVTAKQYNSLVDGDIIKISYHLVKIDDVIYPCDISIKEVVH